MSIVELRDSFIRKALWKFGLAFVLYAALFG